MKHKMKQNINRFIAFLMISLVVFCGFSLRCNEVVFAEPLNKEQFTAGQYFYETFLDNSGKTYERYIYATDCSSSVILCSTKVSSTSGYSYRFYFASASPFTYVQHIQPADSSDDGTTVNHDCYNFSCPDYGDIYYYDFTGMDETIMHSSTFFDYDLLVKSFKENNINCKSYEYHALASIVYGKADDETWYEDYQSGVEGDGGREGSASNPKVDEDIGYLQLKTTNINTPTMIDSIKNGMSSQNFNLDWENRTTSGFSLSNNKYARTFIQIQIESRYVWFTDTKHTKTEKFKNWGEVGWISKNVNPSNKPYTFSPDDVNNALPKSTQEVLDGLVEHGYGSGVNFSGDLPQSPNFRLHLRVVCTNDLAVVPNSSSGWHCGPWLGVDVSADTVNDTSSETAEHEGYGDDKEPNGDTQDITHTHTNYEDNEDAKDNLYNVDVDGDMSAFDAFNKAVSMIQGVKKVPKMLKQFFSFFPDWVTVPFFIGFALIPFVIVYKLLRG